MNICWLLCPRRSIPAARMANFTPLCYAGPMLGVDIPVSVGESVVRGQFVFADLNSAVPSPTLSCQSL